MRPEGLRQLNISVTPSEIEPAQTQIYFTKFNLACEILQITQQLSFILTEEGFVLRASGADRYQPYGRAMVQAASRLLLSPEAVFNHVPSYALFVVEIVAMDSEHFLLYLSLLFYKCSILIFISKSILTRRKAG